MLRVIILMGLALASLCSTAAEVAFLEVYYPDGERVQLEQGGHFAHIAIKYGKMWLHAHPDRGVDLVSDLHPFGIVRVILRNPSVPDPTAAQVERWLGKAFDYSFSWNHALATYCTRLVAEILGINPKPMSFMSGHWQYSRHKPIGQVGLSPDDLFAELLDRGYTFNDTCQSNLMEAQSQ
jgi:hypothetical protein